MKAVCLLSGGMDSSTLAYLARSEGYDILSLHANYGQRTENREKEAARTIANLVGADEHIEVDHGYLSVFGSSSLTDHSIPVEDFNESVHSLPSTYVPFRNGNLLSIATSYAESRGADAIFIGVQAQDYSGYPDCRPGFIHAFQQLIDCGTGDSTHIQLITPFVNMTKQDILRIGLALGVPYEKTWSCYRNVDEACGSCGACHFRLAAFRAMGIKDPIRYKMRD
ncbi:MAG: 7-cyano-7-deazaguanine synthase QueC [Methanoregulaceae archaeon]|nr:7-cyano-7-deazaguanine synthase QueC [Methanoregulaceae archaeon]